jgi:lycopene cyclase domain-containing protein
VNHYQYLLVLAACLVATLPLELVIGARVWRSPARLVRVLVLPVVAFSAWDVAAIATGEWRYNRRYVTGLDLPGRLPVEEVAFFVVIPICALLTFEAVKILWRRPWLASRAVARSGGAAGGPAGGEHRRG